MKHVLFNLNKNKTYITYDSSEYNRLQIDSVLYRRSWKKVSDQEWNNIYIILDLYKLYDMPVHQDSIHNNVYHSKNNNLI